MSNRLAVRACAILKANRTEELRAAVLGECFTLLRDDAEASAIARKLRGFSDDKIAWIEHLSSVSMDLICSRLGTSPRVMVLASKYEAARRRAYHNHEIGAAPGAEAADPRVCPIDRGSAASELASVGMRDGRDKHLCAAKWVSLASIEPNLGPVDADRPAANQDRLA